MGAVTGAKHIMHNCHRPSQPVAYRNVRYLFLTLAVMSLFPAALRAEPEMCTYESYKWHAYTMKAGPTHLVVKPYRRIGIEERDAATGCTVCREDQVEVRLAGVAPFRMCRKLAARAERTLQNLKAQGVPLRTVTGYRVGMTRGEPDAQGYRTRFSNHSFGIALDINEAHNGLYESCNKIGPECRLRKGGKWNPGIDPHSMTRNHPVVLAMKQAGFRWGGEIAGNQKDFMHFSPSGY
jgi:hypothetical protein